MTSNNSVDLPWDPLWEYILGEDEGKKKKKVRRRKKKEESEGGFLSYLFPEEEESRDESWSNSWQETAPVSVQNEKRDDSNTSHVSNPAEPTKTKSKKFWKRNKRQSQEDEPNAWEWSLDPSITGAASLNENVEKRERKVRFANKRQSQEGEPNAWDWSLDPSITGAASSNENVEKRERKVRFAKFTSGKAKNEEPDYGQRFREGTEIAAVGLQKGQKSLLDWVGITGVDTSSTKEEEASPSAKHLPQPKAKASYRKFSMAKEPPKPPPPETGSFPFVGLLNSWGDMTSSGEVSSAASTFESTQGSGTVTSAEEEASEYTDDEEDSKYTADQSEASTVDPESVDDYNEVLLAFKPAAREENGANLLPVLEEDSSAEIERQVYVDNATGSYLDEAHEEEDQETLEAKDRIEGYNSILEELEEFNEMRVAKKDIQESIDLKPLSSVARRTMCRSVKSLNCQQLKWSAETGLPFHELSPTELSTIFPKVRSVTDNQEGVSSELIGNSDAFAVTVPAHLQAEFQNSGPQSLFEYEYETGIHMFVSYYDFGDDIRNIMRVETAPTPPPRIRKGTASLNKTMVQVEASTVSQTDCLTRQGKWSGSPRARLPITPGVDVVGKLYRVDKESSKRYDLSKGDRVLSLVKRGGNSRYLSVDPSRLVKVPESIDPAEAVCLAETYLAAFQILHLGQNEATRYRESSLYGKKVLILGYSLSNIGRATAQLAACAGAAQVYALAKPKHFQQLQAIGVEPLNRESLEWWDALNKNIDIIVSLEEEVVSLHYKCLKPGGQVIMLQNQRKQDQGKSMLSNSKKNLVGSFKKWKQQAKTCFYDVYDAWDRNINQCKNDLRYLIHALEQKRIAPKLIDRIPLSKVSKAHELIGPRQLSGFVICEPWLVAKSRAIRV